MKVKGAVLSTILALILCIQIMFPLASAHTGEMFTLIVREDSIEPGNPQTRVNDTVRWINVDDRKNVTHRILVDANSDGIYNGEDDWDSGNLTNSCEHVNGTKIDENCNADFDIIFNETVMNMSYYNIVGKYAFVDLVFNETSGNTEKLYGNVTVNPDYHLRAGFQDNVVNNEEENDDDERPAFLLIIAAISGIGAIILGGMIIFGNKEED